ncbi:transposase [Microbispora sp. NPDC046933]|uniref:transposase n=1 Tax=Microbispora sp. NPDC046933 TaxID=3155618 RepID=UPI0033C3E03D
MNGASYGERSSERTNSHNGYRKREWDTRAAIVDLAIPKLRQGSTSPTGCWNAAAGPSKRGQRRGHLLSAGRLHATGGQAGRAARDRRHLQEPGLGHGQGAG